MRKAALELEEYTISAREYCYISTQTEAERKFLEQGFYGKVFLECVKSPGAVLNQDICLKNGKQLGTVKFFWVCHDKSGKKYLPLFVNDLSEDDYFLYASSEPVKNTTLLYNGGNCYLLYVGSSGRVTVRIVTVFCRQDLVEALGLLQGIVPKEVYLVRMLTIPDNRYVTTCWNIVAETEVNGETTENSILLPVNLYDSEELNKIGINSLNTSIVYENSILKAHGIFYHLCKNDRGKRYLERLSIQPVQHSAGKQRDFSRDYVRALKKQEKPPAKIIQLFKKDGE